MSLEEHKTIVRRFLEEALVQGNLAVFDTSFAPNFVIHTYGTLDHIHASLRKLIQQYHQALSGRSVTIHDLIAEGDTVAARLIRGDTMNLISQDKELIVPLESRCPLRASKHQDTRIDPVASSKPKSIYFIPLPIERKE